jgi:hypothetical protein
VQRISFGLLRRLYVPDYHEKPFQGDSVSQGRLQGEFTIASYRFAPATGSLEGAKRLLLLFTAFKHIFKIIRNEKKAVKRFS